MRTQINRGYSTQLTNQYVHPTKPIYLLSVQLSKVMKWVDGKPTEDISGYRGMFIQEGLNELLFVKFAKEIDLPPFLSVVEFDNLQACEVRGRVYFKADGLKVKGVR